MKEVLILRYKKYLNYLKKKKINLSLTPIIYFCTWSNTIGSIFLKKKILGKTNYFLLSKKLFYEFFNFFHFYNFKIINKDIRSKNIIFTWCKISDFKKNLFYDRYTNMKNTDKKNTHWVALSIDGLLPKIIPKNLTIIYYKKKFSLKNFFKFVIFIKSQKNNFTDTFFFYYNLESKFSYFLSNVFLSLLETICVKKITFIYESQPYQNYIISVLKKKKKDITIQGYIHSGLPAFPAYLIKKECSPHKIFVDGIAIKRILVKYLFWKKNQIIVQKTLRYKFTNKLKFKKKIFLPYDSEDFSCFLNEFIYINSKYNLSNYQVNNHPAQIKSELHLNFKKKIEKLLNFNINKSKELSTPIFFGTTQSVLEALENNLHAIHIFSNQDLQSFAGKIWSNIKCSEITKNVFVYSVIKNKQFINY